LQRDEWTFDGCDEVTVNIFSLHANEFVVGIKMMDTEFLSGAHRRDRFNKYFSKPPTYEDWRKDCYMGLVMFAQLIKHFGWQSMRTFMGEYEVDINANDEDKLPKGNQEKIDQWVLRYSKIVNRNIKPQFEMFGLPVSEHVDDEIGNLDYFSPYHERDFDVFISR
jgi:hypothetical protein